MELFDHSIQLISLNFLGFFGGKSTNLLVAGCFFYGKSIQSAPRASSRAQKSDGNTEAREDRPIARRTSGVARGPLEIKVKGQKEKL